MGIVQEYDGSEMGNAGLVSFLGESLRKVTWPYILWLITAGIVSYGVYSLTHSSPMGSVRPALLIYYCIITVHIIFRLKVGGKGAILSPDMLFLVFYTMFHLGYVTFFAFNILPYSDRPFFFESSIPKALFAINLGLVSFLFGHEILSGKNSKQQAPMRIKVPRASWCFFGLVCMIIAVSAHLIVLPLMAPQFMRYGYRALQRIDEYSNSFLITLLWRYSLHLMILGILVYTVSSALRYGKLFRSKLALSLWALYLILVILEGDRGPIVQLGVPILLVRHYFVKRIKVRYLVVMTVAALVLFTAMAIVRTIVFQPAKMLQEYQYHKEAGAVTWMNPFIEMGSSFLAVNITCQDVPAVEPYWLGASWRDAIIHIVPFLQGFASRFGVATWAPSTWLTTTYFGEGAAGRAFTVVAEGYLNFGYLGVIIELTFLGLFLRWLTIKFSRNPSSVWGIIMFGGIGIVIMTVRGHVGLMFASVMRVIVASFLLNLFLKSESVYEYEMEEYDELYQHEIPCV